MLARVALACARSARRLRAGSAPARASVALEIPASPDTQDLHVGFERLERAQEREQARALGLLGKPLIGGAGDRERRPAVVEALAEHAVAVDERDRRAVSGRLDLAERRPAPQRDHLAVRAVALPGSARERHVGPSRRAARAARRRQLAAHVSDADEHRPGARVAQTAQARVRAVGSTTSSSRRQRRSAPRAV